MTIIKSNKFILRLFRKEDQDSLMENINNRKIARNTLHIPFPYKASDARSWIDYNLKMNRKANKEEINFVIDIKREVAGCISIRNIKKRHMAEISYWLGEKYWGQGIMTSALKEITKYAFRKLKLRRLEIGIFPFNAASKRVAEKAGYQYEGRMRKIAFKKGRFMDSLLYTKLN
jgi:RimJ/RimL family protein N-acetyltransferase